MISRRRLRILVYEPRPSWAAAFVRQALESDQVFEVQARTNTSSGIGTMTAQVKGAGLAETDAYDALAIGGLESVTPVDLERLNHFVSVRGGTVVLLPDARIPESVRVGLELPLFDEALVERPVDVHSKTATLRASEFLLPKAGSGSYRELATVRHLGAERAAVIALARGSGQLLISGLLDGWRFRADNKGSFEQFWRGVIADGALQSPPPVAIEIDPAVAAPGQPIRIRATLRETEWSRSGRDITLPMLSASLIPADGRAEMIRLWPAATPGVYTALLTVPSSGRYSVRVESASASAEMPLMAEDAAASVTPDHSASLVALARASGGGEFDVGLDALIERLHQMDLPVMNNRVQPMRSGWWILPFAGLLTAEWTIRRRKGQR